MNAPLLPEILSRLAPSGQADLPLATEGVLRYVWEGQFGQMLIEVRDGVVYVNGQPVEAAETTDTGRSPASPGEIPAP